PGGIVTVFHCTQKLRMGEVARAGRPPESLRVLRRRRPRPGEWAQELPATRRLSPGTTQGGEPARVVWPALLRYQGRGYRVRDGGALYLQGGTLSFGDSVRNRVVPRPLVPTLDEGFLL